MTRDPDTDAGTRTDTDGNDDGAVTDRPADDPTFDADAVFDPETYLPTVEAALGEGRTAEEVGFLEERFGTDERLLDAPCGHGRHANRLAERGYRVAGLDRSEPFLERARDDATERGVADRVDYRHGDLRSLPYDDRAFDGVYNLFTSFGFFDDAQNREVLAEFARVLRPGGRLVMELANRDGVLYDYRHTSTTDTGAGTVVEERTFDPRTGRNRSERLTVLAPENGASQRDANGASQRDANGASQRDANGASQRDAGGTPVRTTGDDGDGERDADYCRVQEATYEVRLYSFTELRALLSRVGFDVVEAYGGTDESDLSLESTRMVVVAERSA